MSNFQNAKIYKIFNSINPKVYVGSTTRTLETRLIEHRSQCKDKKYTSHIIIDEDPENCGIEIVEEYLCNNLSELKVREAYWKKKLDCECGGKYTRSNKSNHKKTDKHKDWVKQKSKVVTWKDIPTEIVIDHIFPWVMKFKFRDCKIPRMLIDHTRIQNPNMLIEFNKLDNFNAAQSLQVLYEQMKLDYVSKFDLQIYEGKFYGVLKHCDDYCELDKLPFFLLMMKEKEGIEIETDDLDFYKGELLSDEWDFSEYNFYLEALCDKKFSEQLFGKLLIDHEYLLQVKN